MRTYDQLGGRRGASLRKEACRGATPARFLAEDSPTWRVLTTSNGKEIGDRFSCEGGVGEERLPHLSAQPSKVYIAITITSDLRAAGRSLGGDGQKTQEGSRAECTFHYLE